MKMNEIVTKRVKQWPGSLEEIKVIKLGKT